MQFNSTTNSAFAGNQDMSGRPFAPAGSHPLVSEPSHLTPVNPAIHNPAFHGPNMYGPQRPDDNTFVRLEQPIISMPILPTQPISQPLSQQQPISQPLLHQQPAFQQSQQFSQQQPMQQQTLLGLDAQTAQTAQIAPGGVAFDVPAPHNSVGVVNAQPLDHVTRVHEPLVTQTHHGGLAFDVPLDDNKTGVVNAHPLDGVHRIHDQPPSRFHHHDFAQDQSANFEHRQHLEEMNSGVGLHLHNKELLGLEGLHESASAGMGMQQPKPLSSQNFENHQPLQQQPPLPEKPSHVQQQPIMQPMMQQQQPLMSQQQQPLSMNQSNLGQTAPQTGAIDQSRPAIVIMGLQPQQLQALGLQQPMQQQPIAQQPLIGQQQLLNQQPLMNQPPMMSGMQQSNLHTLPNTQMPPMPGQVGTRWYAYNQLEHPSEDGHLQWKAFAAALDKDEWKQDQAREQWDLIDTDKNGWMTRSDFLRFANQPTVSPHIQRLEAKLGGTGAVAGSIPNATENLAETGLDTTTELYDNTPALTEAGAIYSSTVANVGKDVEPKTSSSFTDRVSQFFNKGAVGNRLFTFIDEEDGVRSGVVSWGQLMPLLSYGQWDANLAQHAWWKRDTGRTGTMTRSEFVKFAEQEECRGHIQLMEAELTGKAGAGSFGKKIPREEFKADPNLSSNITTGDGMQRPIEPTLNQTSTFNQQQLPLHSTLNNASALPVTNNSTGFRGTDASTQQGLNQSSMMNQQLPNEIDAFRGAQIPRD